MPIAGGYNYAAQQGIQNSSQPPHIDIIKKDFGQTILWLQRGGMAPIFAMLSALKTTTALNTEHGYYQKGMMIPATALTVAVADGAATTFTVADSSRFLPNMVLMADATGEQVLITAINSATSITVARGIGGTAAAAIANSSQLIQVGTAFEEASNRPESMSINPLQFKNFTQIFKNSWAVSGTATQIQHIVGDGQVAENRKDCTYFHQQALETSILFGAKYTGTRNGKPFRTMEGIFNNLKTPANYPADLDAIHVYTVGDGSAGSVTWAALQGPLESCYDVVMEGNGDQAMRKVFCGKGAIQIINEVCRKSGQMELMSGMNEFGMQIRKLMTARGEFELIEHPILNMNPAWYNYMFVLNLNSYKLAYLGDRKTKHTFWGRGANGGVIETDSGIDAIGGSLLTELTMEHRNPAANAVIKLNGTAGAS